MELIARAAELQLKMIEARKILNFAGSLKSNYTVLRLRGIDPGFVKNPIRESTEKQVAYRKRARSNRPNII